MKELVIKGRFKFRTGHEKLLKADDFDKLKTEIECALAKAGSLIIRDEDAYIKYIVVICDPMIIELSQKLEEVKK